MKRVSILLVAVTLIAWMVGCGQLAYELTTDSTDTTEDQLNFDYATPALSSYVTLPSNDGIEMMLINSPPTPPVNVRHTIANIGHLTASAVILNDVPTSEWTYGCTATSAGMLFGYYDRTGYPNMYTGPANGGVCPLTDLGQGIPTNPRYPIPGSCYIMATENGLDGIGSNAHVDDYWISYGSAGPDPWQGSWPEHTWELCTADFLGTNQWKWDYSSYPGTDGSIDHNTDGSTSVWTTSDGSKLYDWYPGTVYGTPTTSCCHGLRLFAESRGYSVDANYNQLTDNQHPNGFTFAEFQSEINAGRPVLIHVIGHTMVGIGCDTATNSIYLHNTWDNNVHSMTWGGSYAGMDLYAVTVIHLAAPSEYSLIISSTSGGSVTIPGEGAFTRYEGMVIDLVATPDEGYRFDEWTGDVGTVADVYSATTTITMNGDYSVTAEFVRQYDLNISSTTGGSVITPDEGTFPYDTGTVVDLVAVADEGYQFTGWTGDIGEIDDPASAATAITVDGEYSIIANFCERPVVSLGFNGVGAGPYPEFDYCAGVKLTVTLFEEYAGQAPYTITWAVAENSTLDGMATVSKGETLFSNVLDIGVYTIQVTSVVDANDCVADEGFLETCQATVTVHEPSTYQFIYDIPEHIVACEETEIPVTFQTDVLGFCGYDNVRYKFYADGPGDVTFKATDSEEVEHTFVNSGYWELEIGLDLPADYSETTAWTVHFGRPGEYSITFSLVNATTDEIIADLTDAEPLTVEVGDILKYYRMLHEPLDEVTTLDLLAAADDWIGSVALPCFEEPITTIQLLALADEWIAAG